MNQGPKIRPTDEIKVIVTEKPGLEARPKPAWGVAPRYGTEI